MNTFPQPDKILRPRILIARLNISMATLYRWQIRPDFPRKIKMGRNSVGFLESEVMQWLKSNQDKSGRQVQTQDIQSNG